MGIGDFLKQATAEIGGGIGRALSDPANTIDKVAEQKRLAGRQEAEDKRAEAKTISEIFTTGLAINNRGERNTYFESVGDKIGLIDPKRLKSISLSRFSDEERKLVLKELDFLDPTEREEFADLIKKFIDSSRLDDAALSVAIDGYVQKAKKRKTERNIGEVRRGIIGEVLKTTEEPGTTPDIGIGVDTGMEPEAPVELTASEKIRIKRDKYNQEKERLDDRKKELLILKKGFLNLRQSPQRKVELERIKEALEFNQKEEEIRLTGVGLLDEREKAILENKLRQEEKQDNADLMDMKIRVRNIYAGGEPLKIIDVNGKPVLNKNGTERYENKVPMRTVKGELVRDSEGEILFFKDADDAGIAIEDELAKKRGESKRRIGKLSSKRTEFDYVQFDRDITNRIKDKQ